MYLNSLMQSQYSTIIWSTFHTKQERSMCKYPLGNLIMLINNWQSNSYPRWRSSMGAVIPCRASRRWCRPCCRGPWADWARTSSGWRPCRRWRRRWRSRSCSGGGRVTTARSARARQCKCSRAQGDPKAFSSIMCGSNTIENVNYGITIVRSDVTVLTWYVQAMNSWTTKHATSFYCSKIH